MIRIRPPPPLIWGQVENLELIPGPPVGALTKRVDLLQPGAFVLGVEMPSVGECDGDVGE